MDAAAGGGDLQVGLAPDAAFVFVLPGAAEDRVGVRIDEAGNNRAAGGGMHRHSFGHGRGFEKPGQQVVLRARGHDLASGNREGAARDHRPDQPRPSPRLGPLASSSPAAKVQSCPMSVTIDSIFDGASESKSCRKQNSLTHSLLLQDCSSGVRHVSPAEKVISAGNQFLGIGKGSRHHRQGVQKRSAVVFGVQSVVENDDDALGRFPAAKACRSPDADAIPHRGP